MTSKTKDVRSAAPDAIVEAVAASAQQIWQAGLGAFAKAQQDGGELFDTLVRDGAQLHKLTQELARDKVPGLTGKVGRLASGSWDKIERIFEDRVAVALRSLDVPSREEVDALRREIDALKAEKKVRQASPAARKAPAKAAAAQTRPARGESARVRS
jgi:poly(hydroxyalkanoate) granule-associated protein